MKKGKLCILLFVFVLLLCGCRQGLHSYTQTNEPKAETETAVETMPEPTVAEDGNPEDVTCKGSYSVNHTTDILIATCGDWQLTNQQLQAWYWAAAAQYRMGSNGIMPDYDNPLDTQICPIDGSVNSWQQYFLKQALNNWHTVAALTQRAERTPLETEAAYKPNWTTHANNMEGKPATKFLYGYDKTYETNTMHQAYLDAVPEMLALTAREKGYDSAVTMAREAFGCDAQVLARFAYQYNYAYMYQTFLGYDLEFSEEDISRWYEQHKGNAQVDETDRVEIRHVLLVPEGNWAECEKQANELLRKWKQDYRSSEATFGELAYRNSEDAGSSLNGGMYTGIASGQLPEVLDSWCFDSARKNGDTAVIASEQGIHIVYFVNRTPAWKAQAKQQLAEQAFARMISEAKEGIPTRFRYDTMELVIAEAKVAFEDILYPDIGHERYPEVPLYLQQDYPGTWFGAHKLSSNGCGITTFAMLATYLSDEICTPPQMCDLYGSYSQSTGTDGMLFINAPSSHGFFFKERVFNPSEAKEALAAGHIVVANHQKGYWTRAAHYILFEKLLENGKVQVRDSNIANYSRISAHAQDQHRWYDCTDTALGYWVFEKKVTTMEACIRCGDPDALEHKLLYTDYLCPKCETAMRRRNAFLAVSVG